MIFDTHRFFFPDGMRSYLVNMVTQGPNLVRRVKSSVMLEILHSLLVSLCCMSTAERSQIPAFSGLGILLARIQTILSCVQFANHKDPLAISIRFWNSASPLPGAASLYGRVVPCRGTTFLRGRPRLPGQGPVRRRAVPFLLQSLGGCPRTPG